MHWEAWVTLALLAAMLLALARQVASPAAVVVGTATALLTLNLLSERFPAPNEFAASFGNEALLTVGALFVVAAGLTRTGALQHVSATLLGRPRTTARAQVRLMLPAGLFSAFMNNTPVVAMLIPVVQEWSRRTGTAAGKLLIPLSYASILGGTCTLIGTSTNLVVQGLLIERAGEDRSVVPMGMFTLAPVGIAVTIAGVALVVLGSPWLLPAREHRRPDTREDFRQYTVEKVVDRGGFVDGKTIADAGLRSLPSLFLIEVQREGEVLPAIAPHEVLRGGDRLIFAGAVESVAELQALRGLSVPAAVDAEGADRSAARGEAGRVLVEAVVSHTSSLVGERVRDARFRTMHEAAIVAVRRHGERIGGRIGDITLKPGDSLLLDTTRAALARLREADDFYVASGVAELSPPNARKIATALVILGSLVLAMILASLPWPGQAGALMGRVSVLYLALAAAGAMVVTGCLTQVEARGSINWGVLLVIGAALFVAKAVESTGLASATAATLMEVCRPLGPWGVLAGVYVATLILTELVTNNAAAALAFPFAFAAAHGVGAEVMPFAIAIAVAASCGFATPLGYQTHLMVLGPGRYTFGDFVRIGLPMDIVTAATALAVIPVFFPLTTA